MKEIIYFLPDDNLGVASIVRNLLKYRPKSNNHYKVIFTRQIERNAIHINDRFNVDEQVTFVYSKYENLYSVFNRLSAYISNEESILVANDGLELRMVRALKLPNPLIYIIHGDFNYYYDLSIQNQGIIDKYIAYSKYTKQQLQYKLLPENSNKVVLQYYPVPKIKTDSNLEKEIDMLFVGSFNERKGVQFLKDIYNYVHEQIDKPTFKLIGSGEQDSRIRNQFKDDMHVSFAGQLHNKAVLQEMQKSKVLVFPSLSEGLPNVVVEAMKAKCIPVCSDIPSGIPDLIDHGITGFKVPVGNTKLFADYIIKLLTDHNLSLQIGIEASTQAENLFDPYANAEAYEMHLLQTNVQKKQFPNYPLGGILNQQFIPNGLVKTIRKLKISKKL